jgi:hypothetical protein
MAGTAVYGTVCTVVREDGGREPSSYPMCARHGVLRLVTLFRLLWWQLGDLGVKVLYRPGKGNG